MLSDALKFLLPGKQKAHNRVDFKPSFGNIRNLYFHNAPVYIRYKIDINENIKEDLLCV